MRRAALAGVSVLFTLLVAELGLRAFQPSETLPGALAFMGTNAFRGNYLRPGYEDAAFRINSRGMRGPEIDPRRPRRIVCMGDSATFGIWVEGVRPEERETHFDSYPDLLASRLQRAGYAEWQVVNAGVPGSTAAHSLRILRREVLELGPEIVTLRVGINDHALVQSPFMREPESALLVDAFYLAGASRLFELLGQAQFRLGLGKGRPIATERQFREDLEEFARVARRNGIHLVLIDSPLRPLRAEDPVAEETARFWGGTDVATYYADHDRYQRALRDFAGSEDVPLLVTAPALVDSDRPGFSDDIVHPSDAGMETIATLLYRFLVGRGWLGEPASG